MKKIISILIAVLLIFSFPAFAEETANKVEISFKVGDSTLLINGKSVTVETPYVAGEGHTLVPLRVITEAFGAKVEWEGTEKKIFLSYPDVDVTLQIDNRSASVNTHTETLPVAPVLTSNGVTMVPLRFLSETFGADVSYDEETKAITVTKESKGDSVSLSGTTDKPRVGDSYFGWSMDTPKEMFMDNRSFDGTSTEYVSNKDENNYICVYIAPINEDFSFEKAFADEKSSLEGYTLLKADKLTDENNNKYMHFRIKDEYDYYDYKIYYTKDYEITVITNATVDSEEIPYLQAISDSFKTSFSDKDSTYDLSNVEEDGYRVYENEEYKVSFKVPKEFCEISYNAKNEMEFRPFDTENPSSMKFAIYSKEDSITAQSLALKDYNHNRKYINKDFVSFTGVEEYKLNDSLSGYQYTMEIKGTKKQDCITYDIFFELGKYVYNVSLSLPEIDKGKKTIIIPSIKADELDFDKTGILLRNDFEEEGTYVSKGTNFEITLPLSWEEISAPTTAGGYFHKATASIISVVAAPDTEINSANIEDYVKEAIDTASAQGAKIIKKLTREKLGDKNYYHYISEYTNEDITTYTLNYIVYNQRNVVAVSATCSQLVYCDELLDEIKSIIKTLTVKTK